MDNTVIILIAAGVCCIVVGTVLFIKLITVKPAAGEEQSLLDEEYAENFQECFKETGNIEDTLDQLADIYMGNQYMHNLIEEAIDFIHEEDGDYETALEKINVDGDVEVMKMHNAAIKKTLEKKSGKTVKKTPAAKKEAEKPAAPVPEEGYEEDEEESNVASASDEHDKEVSEHEAEHGNHSLPLEDTLFDEDDEDDSDMQDDADGEDDDEENDEENDDDDDLDGFKIG